MSHETPLSKSLKCDFCSQSPQWYYRAQSFRITTQHPEVLSGRPITFNSDNQWAACAICKDLIEANNKNELLQRSLQTYPQQQRLSEHQRHIISTMIQQLHAAFWASKISHPIQIEDC